MVAMFPSQLVNFPLTCFPLQGTSEYVWTSPDLGLPSSVSLFKVRPSDYGSGCTAPHA